MKKNIEKIFNNKFAENTIWLIGQNIYSMLLSLIIGAISARYLGPSNYGLLGYSASIISFFSSVGTLGFDSIMINEIISKPEKKGVTLGTCFGLRFICSGLGYLGTLGMTVILNPDNKLLWLVVALQGISLLIQMYEVFSDWFNAMLLSKYTVIAYICGITGSNLLKVFLLIIKANVIWFAFASSMQVIITAVFVIYFFVKKKDFKISFSLKHGRYLLSNSYHYIIVNLAIILYTQMDKIMIGDFMSEYDVGIYTAAVTIANLWEFIPMAIIKSARPKILEKRNVDYKLYIKRLEILFGIITIMSILVSLGMCIFGKVIIWILYGKDFLESYLSLSILIWATMFAMLGCVRGIWLVAEGYNQYGKYYTILGTVSNLIFNFFAIQKMGIIGAAWGTLLSQVGVCFIFPLFWKKTRVFVKIYIDSLRNLRKNMKDLLCEL
ncbi:MAG: flippase [Lachnospiraceae bacterium]|nr:flippase [Lachnospiraceae bacterium]